MHQHTYLRTGEHQRLDRLRNQPKNKIFSLEESKVEIRTLCISVMKTPAFDTLCLRNLANLKTRRKVLRKSYLVSIQ